MKIKPLLFPDITQDQFEREMALVPRNYFFPTIEDLKKNIQARTECLIVLSKSKAFSVSEQFSEDFLSRND